MDLIHNGIKIDKMAMFSVSTSVGSISNALRNIITFVVTK